jgi:hypothetical protein
MKSTEPTHKAGAIASIDRLALQEPLDLQCFGAQLAGCDLLLDQSARFFLAHVSLQAGSNLRSVI